MKKIYFVFSLMLISSSAYSKNYCLMRPDLLSCTECCQDGFINESNSENTSRTPQQISKCESELKQLIDQNKFPGLTNSLMNNTNAKDVILFFCNSEASLKTCLSDCRKKFKK